MTEMRLLTPCWQNAPKDRMKVETGLVSRSPHFKVMIRTQLVRMISKVMEIHTGQMNGLNICKFVD